MCSLSEQNVRVDRVAIVFNSDQTRSLSPPSLGDRGRFPLPQDVRCKASAWKPQAWVLLPILVVQAGSTRRSDTPSPAERAMTMNRNLLYLIIGAFAVAAVVLGYLFYQERQKTSGIEVNVDGGGISIETK